MKSTVVVFACILYCCQAAAVTKEKSTTKDVDINGVPQSVPAITEVTTQSIKQNKGSQVTDVSIGPTVAPTHTPSTTNATTVTPHPTTTNATTVTPPPTTTNATTVTPPPTTTNATTVTPPPSTTNATTVTPPPTTTNATTPSPTKPTTARPIPSSTTAPVTSTTVLPPANRGFDGPSFIGGIVLASGLMAIGFVALKFYRARTELNYHTL